MDTFSDFFRRMAAKDSPREWQAALADEAVCTDRLIRIPTGFGKTLGVLAAWLWHRVARDDDGWPRRLVWCLPMRVLVEQTERETSLALQRLGLLWDGDGDHGGKVGVHLLMGGSDGGRWHLYPEECAVLIGTQDMLLSRALNRGYGTGGRAGWPMEFGLLNQDCLWVMDEVQLMDVGLATSAQLQQFRNDDAEAGKIERPVQTWWMSATLQRSWLEKSPDTVTMAGTLPVSRIDAASRQGHLWDDVSKPCSVERFRDAKGLAKRVAERHGELGYGAAGPTLVVVNTVERAVEVAAALRTDKQIGPERVRLIHSRFRPKERAGWRDRFLNREASAAGTDRIVVATQVVEAGVDLSAALLVTELAPWASLVQRFGRCARWGGEAQVIVADFGFAGEKARPYEEAELNAAREVLAGLPDVAPRYLESFEERHPERLPELYPYEPLQLLLRHELEELFDTTPDLSGADIDVSRFIRSGDERDLQVFWADVEGKRPPPVLKPIRDALCSVPFLRARDWLCGKESGSTRAPRLKRGVRAWVWDWLQGEWREAERRDLYPGQTVLVAAECGGYEVSSGWNPDHHGPVPLLSPERAAAAKAARRCWRLDREGNPIVSEKEVTAVWAGEVADAAQESEALSTAEGWQTIAVHGWEAAQAAEEIAGKLVPRLSGLLALAGRWHDVGKAHDAFQASIRWDGVRPLRRDLAKAPDAAWPCGSGQMYTIGPGNRRGGFRHELAGTLALFALLRRHDPDHPALLGPWREWLERTGVPLSTGTEGREPGPLEREILALDADRFDLLAYLVCSHHGKVRVSWHAGPADQESDGGTLRIRGISQGDELPALPLATADGQWAKVSGSRLDLAPAAAGLNAYSGRGWTERVLGLLERHGPFTLAWLEALFRAADQRVSGARKRFDPLLEAEDGLERDRGGVAPTHARGAVAPPDGADSPQGGAEHGLRRGAGGSADAGSRTQAPHHATRYLNTSLGILSYAALAPHLSRRVQEVEAEIAEGRFAERAIDESLLLELHRRICGDLVPEMGGRWRRVEVRVGNHEAPSFPRVPLLVREYCLDLNARFTALAGLLDDRTLECLAFAEGRLLWIHPFADFNGRTTRLLLAELLRRLALPDLDPTPDPGAETERYLRALAAGDRADWGPLCAVWLERFAKGARP